MYSSNTWQLKTNVSGTYRNPYNIWVYDQDVDVSIYDNSKTHYNKSATVQLNITDTGSSNIVDSCPNGQSMYAGLDGLSAPSCTSCAYIPESIRSGISKCSSVVDAPATWQTSVVSGSVDKGVLSSGLRDIINVQMVLLDLLVRHVATKVTAVTYQTLLIHLATLFTNVQVTRAQQTR